MASLLRLKKHTGKGSATLFHSSTFTAIAFGYELFNDASSVAVLSRL
jgi:hypothetical protein